MPRQTSLYKSSMIVSCYPPAVHIIRTGYLIQCNLIGVKICKMKRHILLVFNCSQNTIFKDF